MKKLFGLTTLNLLSGAAAFAGSVAFDAPVAPELIEEQAGAMGGSGLWLIPLIAIALIFLVARGSSTQTCSDPILCD